MPDNKDDASMYEDLDNPTAEEESVEAYVYDEDEDAPEKEEAGKKKKKKRDKKVKEKKPKEKKPNEKKPKEEKEKSSFSLKNMSLKTMYIITGALGGLILIIVIATVIFTSIYKENTLTIPDGASLLKLPSSGANHANYSYIKEEMVIGGQEHTLLRVLVDSGATTLYFDKNITMDIFDVFLIDDLGNTYYPDISNHLQEKPTNKIKFQPLNEGINYFSFKYKEEDEFAEKLFFFRKPLTHRDYRQVQKTDKNYKYAGNDVYATIEEAVFSSDSSIIYYSFSWDNDSYRLSTRNNEPLDVWLYEDSRRIASNKTNFSSYEFDNKIIGRVDYNPVHSIDSNVELKIKNVVANFELNRTLSTDGLFQDKDDSYINMDVGNYRLVIERMAKNNDLVVAVAHVIDKTLPVPERSGNYSNRVEPSLDIDLVYTTGDETTQICKGTVISGNAGCDIVFKDESLVRTMPADIKLRVNSIGVPVSDFSFDIDLKDYENKEDIVAQSASKAVLDKFYEDGKKNLFYTAQIISYSVDAENERFYCQVWDAAKESGSTKIGKYAVVAEASAGNWSIKSIEHI